RRGVERRPSGAVTALVLLARPAPAWVVPTDVAMRADRRLRRAHRGRLGGRGQRGRGSATGGSDRLCALRALVLVLELLWRLRRLQLLIGVVELDLDVEERE